MLWIAAVLIAAVAATAGFVLVRKKRPRKSLVPRRVARKLVRADPHTVSVAVLNGDTGGREATSIASCSFLRRRGRIYRERKSLYLTMDKPRSAGGPEMYRSGDLVSLSFLHRGVPHSVTCRWMGKTRLGPKTIERLDSSCKTAYRVHPVSRIRREEKRTFLRYPVAANDGYRARSTPYISFEAHIAKTDREVGAQECPTEILDLGSAEFSRGSQRRVDAATVINQLRAYMLIKPPEERKVQIAITQIAENQIAGSQIATTEKRKTLAGRLRNHLNHRDQGCWAIVALLDLEGDSPADALRILPPVTEESKATGRALLDPEDRVLVTFDHGGKHHQMEAEAVTQGVDSVCLRPTGQIRGEASPEASVIDFSAGGALIQGSRKFIEFLLDRKVGKEELSSDNPARGDILKGLRRHLVKLTFHPKLNFPEIGKRFQPRIPSKICVLAQIVRSQFVPCKGGEVLQHGVKFVYDEQADVDVDGMVSWRKIKEDQGNGHFNEIHAKLGRLSGFLESESRDKGLTGVTQEIAGNRVAFVVEKRSALETQRQVN